MRDGTKVAVKQLIKSQQMLPEFLNEIVVISSVRHRNLVKLKGCCISGDQRILVYEYVENQNLAEALWGMSFFKKFDLMICFLII
jgi:serine/threonine protein kinase